jgi:16S rRNA (cytosine967-C5)-methyltransferase
LAPDSLALSLLLAARVVAAVRNGQSLTEALACLSGEPAGARAGAQDAAYGVFRHYGQGEFILQRLLSKPLSHDETVGLLLAALYRLDSRPDAPHTVVDQAVTAAGELAAGAFKGLVNGVLRNYLRQRDALRQAMQQDDVAANAHPAWWLTRLRRAFPDNWAAIVAAGNAQPPQIVLTRGGKFQHRLADRQDPGRLLATAHAAPIRRDNASSTPRNSASPFSRPMAG